jgi:hypothetical protein
MDETCANKADALSRLGLWGVEFARIPGPEGIPANPRTGQPKFSTLAQHSEPARE